MAGFVDFMEVNQEISVVEIEVPHRLIGRSLMESNLRQKYSVVVVAIRRAEGGVIILPTAAEVFKQDDILVIIGQPGDCEHLAVE